MGYIGIQDNGSGQVVNATCQLRTWELSRCADSAAISRRRASASSSEIGPWGGVAGAADGAATGRGTAAAATGFATAGALLLLRMSVKSFLISVSSVVA